MFLLYQAIATDKPRLAHIWPRGNYIPQATVMDHATLDTGDASRKSLGALDRTASIG